MLNKLKGKLSSNGSSSKGVDKDTAHLVILVRLEGSSHERFLIIGEESGSLNSPPTFLKVDAATLKNPPGKTISGVGTAHPHELVDLAALARNTGETNKELKAAKLPGTHDYAATYLWEMTWNQTDMERAKGYLDGQPHGQGQAVYRIYTMSEFSKKVSKDKDFQPIWALFQGLVLAKKIKNQ